VFCGSSLGVRPEYRAAAALLGTSIAGRGLGVVYGGASVGLMQLVAESALDRGGEVIGVITEALVGHEIAHRGLSRLEVVSTMHERKSRMAELADAFVMLPGGFGTCEEFFEAATWSQLGIHDKPYGILNVDNYFEDLLRFIDHAISEQFIRPQNASAMIVAGDVDVLLDALTTGAGGRGVPEATGGERGS